MARPLTSADLVALPQLDANDACVLAQRLVAASRDKDDKPRKLPENIKTALEDVEADRAVLVEALGGVPAPESDVREVDRLEDAAIGAIFDVCAGWERLAGQIPQGDTAELLHDRLFGDEGLGFVNLRPKSEWGVVETKLQTIQREKLEPKFKELGLLPALEHLRSVHARYGVATGNTVTRLPPESPQVRAKLDTLLESMRHHVAVVVGSINRRKPETQALADALLTPLAQWEPRKGGKRKRSREEGGGTGDSGTGGGGGTGDSGTGGGGGTGGG